MTRTSLLPRAVASALVLAATAVLTVSAVAQQPAGNQSAQPTSGSANADLKDVTRHPENYIGKTIVVEGEAIDVLGPHLFVVDARKWFHLWGGMLVVVPEP